MNLLENRAFLAFMRRWWPVCNLPGVVARHKGIDDRWITFVFRRDDCLELLADPKHFPVAWGARIRAVSQDHDFLLGIDDPERHGEMQKEVMQVFRREDLPEIRRICAQHAEQIVADARDGIDAVEDLVTRTAVEVCHAYYGIPCRDQRATFAHDAMTIARFTFMDPGTIDGHRDEAVQAADRIRPLLHRARDEAAPKNETTIADRLVALQKTTPSLSDTKIDCYLLSMMQGFVPTNTLAGAAILDVLLSDRAALAQAQEAARQDDDDRLRRCLLEANRFSPLGPRMRKCPEGYEFERKGRPRSVRKHARVFAVLKSAMFDPDHVRRPGEFDPDRPESDRLLFGWGMHWCVGALIAEVHLTQTLKPLLKRELRRDGDAPRGARAADGFPAPIRVRFAHSRAGESRT